MKDRPPKRGRCDAVALEEIPAGSMADHDRIRRIIGTVLRALAGGQRPGGGRQRGDLPDPPGKLSRRTQQIAATGIEIMFKKGGYTEQLACRSDLGAAKTGNACSGRTEDGPGKDADRRTRRCPACGKLMVRQNCARGKAKRLAILGLIGLPEVQRVRESWRCVPDLRDPTDPTESLQVTEGGK